MEVKTRLTYSKSLTKSYILPPPSPPPTRGAPIRVQNKCVTAGGKPQPGTPHREAPLFCIPTRQQYERYACLSPTELILEVLLQCYLNTRLGLAALHKYFAPWGLIVLRPYRDKNTLAVSAYSYPLKPWSFTTNYFLTIFLGLVHTVTTKRYPCLSLTTLYLEVLLPYTLTSS